MKAYWLMIRFQIDLNLARMRIKENGKINYKQLGIMCAIIFCALVMLAAVGVVEYFLFKGLKLINRPALLLEMAALMVMMMSLLYGVFYIISVLYYSKDTSFLSSLPIPERAIFAGRIATVLIGECALSLLIVMPAVLLYGAEINAGVLYYVQGLVTGIFIPFIPVTIATFFAALLTGFSSLWKRKDLWMVIGVLIIVPLAFFIQFHLTQLSASADMDASLLLQIMLNQQKLLETIAKVFPPAYWSVGVLISPVQYGYWFLFLGLSIGGICLAIFLLGKRYTRLAILSEEANADKPKGKSILKQQYPKHSPLYTLFVREWKELLRSPSYALNSIAMALIFPILMLFMVFTLPTQMQTSNIEGIFQNVIKGGTFDIPVSLAIMVVAALFGFIGLINPAVATAISREGKCHLIYRMIPVSPQTIIYSKFLMGISVSAFDTVFTMLLAVILLPKFAFVLLMGYFISLIMSVSGCCLSLVVDMIKPKFDWRTETEVIKRSTNVLISMLIAFLLLIIAGFACYGIYKATRSFNITLYMMVALMILLAGICGIIMMKASKKYYAHIE